MAKVVAAPPHAAPSLTPLFPLSPRPVASCSSKKKKTAWETYLIQPKTERGCGHWREDQRAPWTTLCLREVSDVRGIAESGACHTRLQLNRVCMPGKPLSPLVQGTEALVKLSFSLVPEERTHIWAASYPLLVLQDYELQHGK